MATPLNLLVIEDDPADFALLTHHIRHQGLGAVCRRVETEAELDAALEESWDLVLADYSLPAMNFHPAITRIRSRWPDLPVVLLSGTVSEEMAVDLLRLGLADFVLKDHLAMLIPAIHRALEEVAERRARFQAEQAFRQSQAAALLDREQARLAALNLMEDALDARTRAEKACAALLESEEKYRLLAENSLDWIFWQGPDGRNKYVSPACLDISGHRPEEFVADAGLMIRLIHPEDQALFLAHLREEQEQNPATLRFRIVRPDGGERWIEHRCELMFDEQRNCLGLHGSNRDISEELRLHAEQDSLRSQLLQAQKMESVGRLAGGVAHDFNNKLSVILGYVDLILMGDIIGEQELRQTLQEVHLAAKQSADLTRQLLAFARRQTVMPQQLDLNEVIGSMLKMLSRLIGEDISLTWIPAPLGAQVLLDPAQVDQILANLAVNARDAINGVGTLTIATDNVSIGRDACAAFPEGEPGDYVVLKVTDNGCGMDQELQQKIFEPFFTTKAVGEGTGLGLSTVYGIVKQNNGFITIDSEPGHGATFGIYLPRHISTEEGQENDKTESLQRGSETVLLVEDERSLRILAQNMLTRLGYEVLAAEDPGKALALGTTYQGRIDLLLSDVVMPGMNGRELADRLAAVRPEMKSLFMSGYTADVIATRGVLDQGVQFLPKPFSIEALASKLRKILDEVNPPGRDSR